MLGSGARVVDVATRTSAAEELALQPQSFDAVICRLGLMLFPEPVRALNGLHAALRPGGKVGVVVFTTPMANPVMAKPMEVLLRHAGKTPPAPGQPGIFALGAPGVLERVFGAGGFVDLEQRIVSVTLRMATAKHALAMMQEAFGAYRAVLGDQPENVRAAAWAETEQVLETFMAPDGFVAPGAVLVASASRAAST